MNKRTGNKLLNFNGYGFHVDTMVINNQFRIVLSTEQERGLVGLTGLIEALGKKNAKIAVLRAFRSNTDKTTVKFRSGFKIEFYVK